MLDLPLGQRSGPSSTQLTITSAVARTGNHLNVQKYMDAPNDEFEAEVKLYVSGDSTGGAGSGVVRTASDSARRRDVQVSHRSCHLRRSK